MKTIRNKLIKLILFIPIMITVANAQELTTVANVSFEKYAGTWHEIASFPQRFQQGCECTTATYTPTDKGYVIVENKCTKNGKVSHIKGKAFVEENSGNAKLKVQFFWPFKGKYWIIDLANDYSYAVVSHPSKKYLWILSRTPTMDSKVYQSICTRLKDKGFDLSKLKVTSQVTTKKQL